ncbi:hypothetical protein PFISCL1PPCAC_24453, partial [Pristionchus fissidentatus]
VKKEEETEVIKEEEKADTKDKPKEEPMETDEVEETEKEVKDEFQDESDEDAAIAHAGDGKVKKELPQIDLDQLYSEPAFSVICSFFNKFGAMLGVKPYSFSKLEQIFTKFDDNGHIDRELIELNMTLLRRIGYKSVRWDCWEKWLGKFCELRLDLESEYLQMERFGYTNLPVAAKIVIMKALCEAQFDYNIKFKENILLSSKSSDLRLLPVGSDCTGLAYWYQQDSELAVRVYTEEQDDKSGGTWKLIASSSDQLQSLIDDLKTRDLGYVKKEKTEKERKVEEKKEAEKGDDDMVITTKKGTFLDTFQDPEMVKKKREAMEKAKEQRKNKGGNIDNGAPEPKKVVNEDTEPEEEKEKEKKEVEVEVKKPEDDEDSNDVPDDLKQFMDRRILPRRSARASAITSIRSFITTPQKRKPVEKKDNKETPKKKEEKEDSGVSESGEESEDEGEEGEDEDEEDEEEAESGDEFVPSSEKKKAKSGKRRRRNPEDGSEPKKRRKKKKKIDFDDMEEDDEDGEEVVLKERKKANQDSRCKKCKKSDHWEVLLLCDECDDAWHTWCLTPQLWFVPDDDWFCPKCTHGMLIEKLCRVMDALKAQMKVKEGEDKKKKASAERLRREMAYIGVSLNNIIPVAQSAAVASSSSDEDDGQRKCKKKAVKRLNPDRYYRERQPLVTIAEGRSRRGVAKVDYNFSHYDEMLKEAMEIEEGEPRVNRAELADTRPQGGAGRGKDMRNIIEAEEKRRASVDEGEEGEEGERGEGEEGEGAERMTARPALSAAAKKKHHKRKLNDLNSDDEEESEQSEYEEKDAEEEEEAEPASGSDYMPSDEGRGGRGRRARSEEDFIDDDSDEDWGGERKRRKVEKKPVKRGGRRKWESDGTESENSDSDCSWKKGSKKKKKNAPKRGRWDPRSSSEEEEEEEMESKQTASGRPLRRAVVKSEKKKVVISDEEDEEEEEEEEKAEGEEGEKKEEEKGEGEEICHFQEGGESAPRPSTARHPLSKQGRMKKKTE